MSILQRLSLAFAALKGADVGGWYLNKLQEGRPYQSKTDYKSLMDKYASWVYACANKNATNCAQVPLRLYSTRPTKTVKALFPTRKLNPQRLKYLEKSPSCSKYFAKSIDMEEVLEHPLLDLLSNVNEFSNGFDLQELTFLCQDLTGNTYWYLVVNNLGRPEEIWNLLPQYMKIIPNKEKFISGYEFSASFNDKHFLEPEEIIHFKYVNPRDAYLGLGPLQAAVVAADLGMSMNEYEVSLMHNRAQPDFALKLPIEAGEPKEEEKKRIYADWYKKYGGMRNQGKIAITTGGAELQQISLSPKEMNFLMGRKASLNEVAAIFGVPMSKLTTEDVNRANAEAGDYSYMKDTILPRLRKVEQKLNERLCPLYDDNLFCAYDNPVPEDKQYRLDEIDNHLKNGYSNINMERQIDGLEEVEWGNVPILPFNLAPLGSEKPQAIIEAQPVKSKTVKSPRKLPPLDHPTNFVNEEFETEMAGYFQAQKAEVLGNFDKDVSAFKSWLQFRLAKNSRADDYVSAWFNYGRWNTELTNKIKPFVRYTFLNGGKKVLEKLDVERQFDSFTQRAANVLQNHAAGSAMQVNGTTFSTIRDSMAAGLEAGEAVAGLRKRLMDVFDIAERSRATNIARTETIWAWNEGAVEGYIQSGVVSKKQWLSSGDSRSCEFCLSMDGKIVDVEGDFFGKGDKYDVGGKVLSFDYENISHPPIHCQCRCCIVAVIDGE